ncbi:MAG: type IX secretion system sortase PorU [Muribaculaceae bacterium]|nr:type IX secretion system sortase PorU [Muribaculaceae bacterium]
MQNKTLLRLATIVALCVAIPCTALALNSKQFTTTSKLSTGKWVKISVPTDGIYELTADELAGMGFSDISRVAIYGSGGYMMSEVLDGSAPDDLKPVASMLINGKLYFYGCGAVNINLAQKNSLVGMAFQRTINAYSLLGHYFLTEEDAPLRVGSTTKNIPANITSPRTTSLAYWYHERELCSISHTGKDLLGEDLLNQLELEYTLPQIADGNIIVGVRAAAASTDSSYIICNLASGSETKAVSFSLSDSKLFSISGLIGWKYDITMPYGKATMSNQAESGKMIVRIDPALSTPPTTAKLDYAIMTYNRNNAFASPEEGQFKMWFSALKSTDVVALPGADADVMVWDLTDNRLPVNQKTTLRDGNLYFASTRTANTAQMIAFQPSRQQLKVSGYEAVANQNLHGLEVPDLLIVTNSAFAEQAKRLARLHHEHDGITATVVTQEQVFNEFSSGTPDATAVRLLCKMFYDRNSSKFKNLIMFGEGTYDNRGLVQRKTYPVITFESTESKDELTSYACDDYYGFLDDNSGASLNQCLLRIGVGRFTSSSLSEAKSDVDKVVKYLTDNDYGVWRNNFLLTADEGTITGTNSDIGLHSSQAEGIGNLFGQHNAFMHENKSYVEMFPRDPTETSIADVKRRTSLDGRRHIVEALNAGQYFMTYVGHAGGTVFTSHSRLWRSSDVQSNKFSHLPIVTTACCDVARYDSPSRGIAETMFHQPDGGAIALLTSSRSVKAQYNDELNRAFVTAMFTPDADGNFRTLGEAYMQAKQYKGKTEEPNKMSFLLMGDPAIRFNFPRPLMKVTAINGQTVANDAITISPMQRVTFEGCVMTRDGQSIDESFTGNATFSFYGPETYYTSYNIKISGWIETVKLYLERPLLAQVEGRVENGHFTGSFTVPRYEQSSEPMQLLLYAHKTGTEEMVNGGFANLNLGEYDATLAETDSQSPVIETMFLNDEASFAQNSAVQDDAMLYITASDDVSINMQNNTPGQAMQLMLDGNKTIYNTVKQYATCSDEGRKVNVAFPLTGLATGHHTLTFMVWDVAGNSTSQTINFLVDRNNAVSLAVEQVPAVEKATFNLMNSSLTSTPSMNIKVTNAQGHLVWSTTTDAFPVTWDLKGSNGERVPAGLYKFFGTYLNGNNYGGTSIDNLIVIDPIAGN